MMSIATFIHTCPSVKISTPSRLCDILTSGHMYIQMSHWPSCVICIILLRVSLCVDMVYVSKWVHMNMLSLDTERVFIQRGEEPLKRLLTDGLGLKTIEVDMRNAFHLGGAFHCWTLDIRRRGVLDKYL